MQETTLYGTLHIAYVYTQFCRKQALTAAIRAVYGNDVMVSGCWFHYTQAVMNRLKKIGLSDAYNNEETTQVVFHCLLALPLLPVADIDRAFKDVKALVHDDSPSKTLLVQLCRYVERQWINKSTIGAARMSVRDNPCLLYTSPSPRDQA